MNMTLVVKEFFGDFDIMKMLPISVSQYPGVAVSKMNELNASRSVKERKEEVEYTVMSIKSLDGNAAIENIGVPVVSVYYTVVAGKYEQEGNNTTRNYKYISVAHPTFEAALVDYQAYVGYPFCEIEYVSESGETWRMNPYSLESKVLGSISPFTPEQVGNNLQHEYFGTQEDIDATTRFNSV